MEYTEENIINKLTPNIIIFKRYVDDCFCIESDDNVDNIFDAFNNFNNK